MECGGIYPAKVTQEESAGKKASIIGDQAYSSPKEGEIDFLVAHADVWEEDQGKLLFDADLETVQIQFQE